jgi:hypothetical protein
MFTGQSDHYYLFREIKRQQIQGSGRQSDAIILCTLVERKLLVGFPLFSVIFLPACLINNRTEQFYDSLCAFFAVHSKQYTHPLKSVRL